MKFDAQKLPNEWRVIPIGEAYTFTKKPRGLSLDSGDTVPFLPMDTIPIGRVYVSNFQERQGSAITSGTYVENGDLLVAKITPSFENGKQAIVDWDQPFGFATTEIIPIREVEDQSDKHYLFYLLLHPQIRSDLAGKMYGTTGRQRLSKEVLASYSIPLPPIEEQRKIAAILGLVQQAIEEQERLIQLTTELKKALLQKTLHRRPPQRTTKNDRNRPATPELEDAETSGLMRNHRGLSTYDTRLRRRRDPGGPQFQYTRRPVHQ